MNAPFDLKNLINPFAIPPKKTLADVAQQVAAADLPAVRKRDLSGRCDASGGSLGSHSRRLRLTLSPPGAAYRTAGQSRPSPEVEDLV